MQQPANSQNRTAAPVILCGGSGFIGSRLAGVLSARGVPFRIGDLRPSSGFPEHYFYCDVRKHDTLLPEINRATAIVNLAAEHRDDVRPVSRYYETNVQGAEQVCIAARMSGVQKIIFTSSVAVYGFRPEPVDEEGECNPFNPYGTTKLEAEGVYFKWAEEDPTRTLVIVRPSVVFGEGNRGNVYNLIRQLASGRFLMVGSGRNVKSMAYVGNVAEFLAHTLSFGPGVHVFNYVDGPEMDTNSLIQYIRGCLGKNGDLPHVPRSLAMAGAHVLDMVARVSNRTFPISAIRIEKFCESTQFIAKRVEATGFRPSYSIQDGLKRTIAAEFSHSPTAPQPSRLTE